MPARPRRWPLSPPHAGPVAPLTVAAARVDPELRPAIRALAGAGVVVHELAARVLSNGRLFLDISEVSAAVPRLPWLVPARPHRALPQPATSAPLSRPDRTPPTASPAGDADDAPPAPAWEAGVDDGGTATVGQDAAGDTPPAGSLPASELSAIARSPSRPAPLVWVRHGVRHEATLTAEGWIDVGDERRFTDPQLAMAAVGGEGGADAWSAWRFGEHGPTLPAARDEVLAHRERHRRGTPRGSGLRRRARRRREASG